MAEYTKPKRRSRRPKRDERPLPKGKCADCVFLLEPKRLVEFHEGPDGPLTLPICAHHADSPGVLREVHPCQCCPNFRAKRGPVERIEVSQPDRDDVRCIPLTLRMVTTVDAPDYEWLSAYRWFAKGTAGKYYAGRAERGEMIMMHREIMKPPPGMVVDHIDGDSLNNRRNNLRICTPGQNNHNRTFKGNNSGFAGVYRYGKRWKAMITYKGEQIMIGAFDDKIEAARARDRKALEIYGPFACLNFPPETP